MILNILRSIPRITSTISLPPDVIQHSSVTIPIRIYSSRPNAFNTGLIPTNTALPTLAIHSVVVPQHAVIPLNAGSCLCSLGISYRTCFFIGSREYSSGFGVFAFNSRHRQIFQLQVLQLVLGSIFHYSNDSPSTRSYAGHSVLPELLFGNKLCTSQIGSLLHC